MAHGVMWPHQLRLARPGYSRTPELGASCWGSEQVARLSAPWSAQQHWLRTVVIYSSGVRPARSSPWKNNMNRLFLVIRSSLSIWNRYTLPSHYIPPEITTTFLLFLTPPLPLSPFPCRDVCHKHWPVPDGFTSRQPHVTFGDPSCPSLPAVTHILNITHYCRKRKSRRRPAWVLRSLAALRGKLWAPSIEQGWGARTDLIFLMLM